MSIGNVAGALSPSFRPPRLLEYLRALHCLAAIAQHGSAVKAAAAIHLSQPAITRAIAELEKFTGLQLFERTTKGMVPTSCGAQLAQRAQFLQQQLEKGVLDASAVTPATDRHASAHRFASAVSPSSLRALAAVALWPSETLAAQHLGLTQPAVHRALKSLEHLAGMTLMQKSPRGTRLTQAGEALLRRVKLAIAEASAMEADIAHRHGHMRGRIVIGALPLSVTMILPKVLSQLFATQPEVEVTVIDGTYESLLQKLLYADVDVILGAMRVHSIHPELHQTLLFEDELAVVVRQGHPCLERGTSTLQQLMEWPWVWPLEATPANQALEQIFSEQEIQAPSARLRATSPSMTRALVLQSDYCALMSRGEALAEQVLGAICMVPVKLPDTVRPIGMVRRAMGQPSPDLQLLLNLLQSYTHQAH